SDDRRRRARLRAAAERAPRDSRDGHARDERTLLRRAARQRVRLGAHAREREPPRREDDAAREPVARQPDRRVPEHRRNGEIGHRARRRDAHFVRRPSSEIAEHASIDASRTSWRTSMRSSLSGTFSSTLVARCFAAAWIASYFASFSGVAW